MKNKHICNDKEKRLESKDCPKGSQTDNCNVRQIKLLRV